MSASDPNATGQGEAGGRARIAELERSVEDCARQRDAAVTELEAFSHAMAHDLRAPLRGIAGFARSLDEDHGAKLDDEGRRLLRVIREEARRAGRLIEDLAGYSGVGRQPLDAAEIDMTELARSAFQNLVEAMATMAPALHLAGLPAAHGDRALVRQVFNQMLGNAIKFTGGRAGAAIEVTGTTKGAWNTYCVADNGTGFDPRYAQRLFGLFQRLHRAEDFAGSGVGLAIVQRIVHRHGGRTWAEGEVNGGARFYFTLPLSPETLS